MLRLANRWRTTAGIVVTLLAGLVMAVPAGMASAHGNGTLLVRPGQSIQATIDAAGAGDRIVVLPGTYAEQLTITTNGLSLTGLGAVLVPPRTPAVNLCSGIAGPNTEAGICVAGHDVKLADFVTEHRAVEHVGTPVDDVTVALFQVRGFSGPNVAF